MAIETNLGNVPLIFAGEDRTLSFTVLDDAGATAVDVTGWDFSFVAGSVTLGVGTGITVTSATSGLLEVALSATDTTSLTGISTWRLRRTDAGNNTVLGFGSLRVTA